MSAEAAMIAEAAERLFGDFATADAIEAAEAGRFPTALWDAFAATGLAGVLVPEAMGGAGGGMVEAAAVLRAAARHAVPAPVAESVAAAAVAAAAGIALPGGPATLATGGRGHGEARLVRGGVVGSARRVPWGRDAGNLVLVVDRTVLLVDAGEASRVHGRNLAGEPRDDLTFDSLVPLAAADAADFDAGRTVRLGALFRSVQIAGALERVLEMSVAYAGERVQFGRPLARFQAIQHHLASLAGQVAAAGAAADAALAAWGGAEEAFAVAVAKARAGEAAGEGAAIAHQVHGAMGFTREHGLHRLTRRLWSWREEHGNEAVWNRRLGARVCAAGADRLWSVIAGA